MWGGKSSQDFLHLQWWRCVLLLNFIWNLNFLDFLWIYLCDYQWAIQIRKWCSPRLEGTGKGYTVGLNAETACFVCVQVSPPGLPENKQITEIASFWWPIWLPKVKNPQTTFWLAASWSAFYPKHEIKSSSVFRLFVFVFIFVSSHSLSYLSHLFCVILLLEEINLLLFSLMHN